MDVSIIVLMAVFACSYAQVYILPGHEKDPYYMWDTRVGNGKIFGTLGQNDQGLFGKGGYNQEIFNDHRGKLQGQAYGTRVLGAGGGSSHLGGKLDWSNKNAQAALELSKQVGGPGTLSASGSGVWNPNKNTQLSAGGAVNQNLGGGKPDVAVQAQFEHKF